MFFHYSFSRKYVNDFFGNTFFLVKKPLMSEQIYVSLTKNISVVILRFIEPVFKIIKWMENPTGAWNKKGSASHV